MAFGTTPRDLNQIPIGCVYVPGVGFRALQGSVLINSDGLLNISSPANFNMTQLNSIAVLDAATLNNAATGAGMQTSHSTSWNGGSYDRTVNNQDNVGIFNITGGTTAQTDFDRTNYNSRGMILVFDMTAVGTGSVTVVLQGKEPVSGKYYTILTGAAITTNTTNVYRIYPGLTAVANATVSDILPRTWRVLTTVGNANPTTYRVSCMMAL